MNEECEIYKSRYYAEFSYKPRNNKYHSFTLGTWCKSIVAYEHINETDVNLYYERIPEPFLFQSKYLDILKKFTYKYQIYTPKEIKTNNNKLTVRSLLTKMKAGRLRISYGNSRTISHAFEREALAYALGFSALIILFRKRGGYLAYHISKVGITSRWSWTNATQIDLLDAINEIREVKRNGLGKTYIQKNIEEEIKDNLMVEKL